VIIDYIRRLPNLYEAVELAHLAGTTELPSDYERDLRALANDTHDILSEAITGADLGAPDRRRAVIALETLRQSPAKRARINAAARVYMATPREGTPLADRRPADLAANMANHSACVNAEAEAARTLMNLLHTLAA
jgi:hypothetical protein